MAIEFLCPYCQAAIRVPDAAAGKRGKCPACTQQVLVPHVERQPSPPVPSPAAPQPGAAGVGGFESPPAPASPFDFPSPAPETPFPVFGAPAPASEPAGFPPLIASASTAPPFDLDASEPAASFPGAVSSTPAAGGPAAPFDVTAPPSGPTAFPSADAIGGPSPLAMKYAREALARKRRRRALLRMVVPATAAIALFAVIAAVTWKPTPKLEGRLKGKVLSEAFTLSPKILSTDSVDLSQETIASTLEELSERSEVLVSDRMRIKFRGDPKRGLEVSIDPGVQMVVVQVDLKQDARLSEYCTFEKDAFNEARLNELKPALRKLLIDYDAALKANARMTELPAFRDSVGLAGSTAGVGYVVQATAGNAAFRCVGEDGEGKIFFLIPKGAKTFTLAGRKLPDGKTPFAGKYTVDVEQLPAEKESEEPPASKGKGAKDDDKDEPEPEMKPEMKSDEDQKS